ncbi:uncharacterized protein STEHIDRAFT_104836 [Stereum hirsutum FP-91666 SS1]|uniref:uncharacterized protein n=1 Tax=Stereum hirsutum (strain FP-91666) TaxID=721885 RepID=UPI0004449893|nr:uncharacterized protein STEHIDRAFT_104836 [Stereum hirsutum FP-91666 SS1]EIM80556.1 hypothetical protein STEHIDRAFT_104836 [Stereum hirsutum FP-91666 SS1]
MEKARLAKESKERVAKEAREEADREAAKAEQQPALTTIPMQANPPVRLSVLDRIRSKVATPTDAEPKSTPSSSKPSTPASTTQLNNPWVTKVGGTPSRNAWGQPQTSKSPVGSESTHEPVTKDPPRQGHDARLDAAASSPEVANSTTSPPVSSTVTSEPASSAVLSLSTPREDTKAPTTDAASATTSLSADRTKSSEVEKTPTTSTNIPSEPAPTAADAKDAAPAEDDLVPPPVPPKCDHDLTNTTSGVVANGTAEKDGVHEASSTPPAAGNGSAKAENPPVDASASTETKAAETIATSESFPEATSTAPTTGDQATKQDEPSKADPTAHVASDQGIKLDASSSVDAVETPTPPGIVPATPADEKGPTELDTEPATPANEVGQGAAPDTAEVLANEHDPAKKLMLEASIPDNASETGESTMSGPAPKKNKKKKKNTKPASGAKS